MASRKPQRKLTTQARVRVEGLSELNRQLNKLDDATSGRAIEDALMAGMEPIREEAARLTPRSETPGGTTGKGHAADNIEKKVVDKAGQKEGRIGPAADFWYLVFPEFGTPHQPAVAPLRTAADTKFDEAVNEFRDTLRERVRRAL